MSTKTSDHQFLMLSFVFLSMIARIVGVILGVWSWSNWILVAGFVLAWAFVAWGYVETDAS